MYTIQDVSEMTGLTDRTLRSYLSAGFLQGEKVEGKWQFTAEQFVDFLRNESVKHALQARRNSAVFDFLADSKKPENAACVMLDLANAEVSPVSGFFCDAVNCRQGVHMSFHSEGPHARVILTGGQKDVLDILREYREKFPD